MHESDELSNGSAPKGTYVSIRDTGYPIVQFEDHRSRGEEGKATFLLEFIPGVTSRIHDLFQHLAILCVRLSPGELLVLEFHIFAFFVDMLV